MPNISFNFDLYELHERHWEGCLVEVTANVSKENVARLSDPLDYCTDINKDIKFVSAAITDKATLEFMTRRRADIPSLVNEVIDYFHANADTLLEYVGEHLLDKFQESQKGS